MRVEDYTAATTPVLISEEAILDDVEFAGVVTCRLPLHDRGVFALTLLHEALYEIHFILAHFDLELLLQQLDHSLQSKQTQTSLNHPSAS